MPRDRSLWRKARGLARRAGLRTLAIGLYSALLLCVAAVGSLVLTRSPTLWLFGHNRRLFAGNSKYLFLWVSIHRPDLRAVWIADDKDTCRVIREHGFIAHRRWSLAGIMATLRAGAVFYCHSLADVVGPLTRGAFLVNLWHGVGLKATEFGDKIGFVSQLRRKWPGLSGRIIFYDYMTPPDIVASTSDFMQQHFSVQFELPPERCPQLGYPRLDCVADEQLRLLSARLDEQRGFVFGAGDFTETYLYMPTWRDTQRPFLDAALPDLDWLNEVLRARGALLYVKLHPWTVEAFSGDYSNIRVWPDAIEVYSYLDRIDGLITDYSSVLYDFIFSHDRGVILYTFDLATYLATDRSLIYPFDENTAGLRADSFAALCEAIETGRALEPCARIAAVRTKFWEDRVAPMSPVVVDHVETALAARASSR